MAALRSGLDGIDDGVVPRMIWRWPRVRLDARGSRVWSACREVVSTAGAFVLLRRPWSFNSGELVLVEPHAKKIQHGLQRTHEEEGR